MPEISNTDKTDIDKRDIEEIKKPTENTLVKPATKSPETASQPLISPSKSGVIVDYSPVTNGHIGPLVVKDFPSGKIHKAENFKISWYAQGAIGYSLFLRAGDISGSDGNNIYPRTSFEISGSSIKEGSRVELLITAVGAEGIKYNSNQWNSDFLMLTLLPPIITSPKNEMILDKDNVTLIWNSTFDSKQLPFFTTNDLIKVKDLENNQDVFSTNLHEEYSNTKYRNFTFPNTIFASGHKYAISLEEQFHYQSYVSDQDPMVDKATISIK